MQTTAAPFTRSLLRLIRWAILSQSQFWKTWSLAFHIDLELTWTGWWQRCYGPEIPLPPAVHLKERLKVSQSARYSGKQSVTPSVGQAGRQTDRQKPTVLGFFSDGLGYKQWGTPFVTEQPAVKGKCTRPPTVKSAVQFPAGRVSATLVDLHSTDLTLVQILLSTNF